MQENLGAIIDQHYSTQAGRTNVTIHSGYSVTPYDVIEGLRDRCAAWEFNLSHETATRTITENLFYQVKVIYEALAGNRLHHRGQERTSDGSVITDRGFRTEDGIKILWADKSSRAFDKFIGELMEQMRDRPAVELGIEPVATTYRGYKAILSKLGYHATDIQPRIRWAVIFGGLRYMIVYMPRTPGRPRIFCSSVMQFCLQPDDEQESPIQPPIWSILVYMLLVETLNIDDDALRQRFGMVAPIGDSDLGQMIDAQGCRRSRRTMEVDEISSRSGKVAERITLDACPMELLLVNASHAHHAAYAKEQYHPYIHLDRHLGAGWSSVFLSSKSHVVVKFAVVPKKDKAELIRQLGNEKLAYIRLKRITGWVVPRLYGEYEWHGGRALILSDEGRSLSHLEGFTSLPLIERLILFVEMCCIHYSGVEHRDFEPQNVLRKKWSCFLKIVDFGFSDVEHSCPGWRECDELDEVWHRLKLDKDRKVNVLLWLCLDHRLFLLSMIVFPLLAFVMTSLAGIPANWRLWPQMH